MADLLDYIAGGPQMLAVNKLEPHPRNPRLIERTDVVEAIRAQINGRFDPAHAILVRPIEGERYQIISGHNRVKAARGAGLAEIPAWVRELDDAAAYMLLLTSNAQGELSAIERGMHALNSGMDVKAYADNAGRLYTTVHHEACAARVASAASGQHVLIGDFRTLVAIHVAPEWLWPALVEHMLAEHLTVERTKKLVAGVKECDEEPYWRLDCAAIARGVVAGAIKRSELTAMWRALQRYVELADSEIGGPGGSLSAQIDHFTTGIMDDAHPANLVELTDFLRPLVRGFEDAKAARARTAQAAKDRASQMRRAISVDEWRELDQHTKDALLDFENTGPASGQFIKQSGDDIEWAQWSWNPVAGCEHDCPYCYARDLALGKARTAYPFGFAPMLRPTALGIPGVMQVPKEAAADARFKNVFTVSMGDLFGRWVPKEWVEAVLRSCRLAPQWNFLMLTKFPKRMSEFDIPENCWLGTTVNLQARVANAEAAFAKVSAPVKWLSLEPLIEPLKFTNLGLFDWMVIGGASPTEQPSPVNRTPRWHPPFAWIIDLVEQARAAKVRVYFKTNLLGSRLLELPIEAPIIGDPQAAPKVFHYLGRNVRVE